MGLSWNIQNKLDREKITNTDLLLNKIRMYDSGYSKQKSDNKRKFNNINITTNEKSNIDKKYSTVLKPFNEKKLCVICEALNKPERHYPLHLCRNKQQYLDMKG